MEAAPSCCFPGQNLVVQQRQPSPLIWGSVAASDGCTELQPKVDGYDLLQGN